MWKFHSNRNNPFMNVIGFDLQWSGKWCRNCLREFSHKSSCHRSRMHFHILFASHLKKRRSYNAMLRATERTLLQSKSHKDTRTQTENCSCNKMRAQTTTLWFGFDERPWLVSSWFFLHQCIVIGRKCNQCALSICCIRESAPIQSQHAVHRLRGHTLYSERFRGVACTVGRLFHLHDQLGTARVWKWKKTISSFHLN